MNDGMIGQPLDLERWVERVDAGLRKRGFLIADDARSSALTRFDPEEPTIRGWRCSHGEVIAGSVVDVNDDDRRLIEVRFEGPEIGGAIVSLDMRTRFFTATPAGADRVAGLITAFVTRGFAAVHHDDTLPA